MTLLNAPLYKKLKEHAAAKPVSFHVPGHRNGEALAELTVETDYLLEALQTVMKLDVTELSSTDDLHDPQGAIREAQQLAAKTFGAEHTFFLVGGSTSGNLAILLSVCDYDDIVIVQRNVHKSIINGLKLAGAKAVFVSPQIDEQTGLATIPSVEAISQALEAYPTAKAVFLTNPNYYGIGFKLNQWANAVHAYNIPLLIDEAHGAHYSRHPELPTSALAAGADAVVQSTHKTLPALTMSAMLHIQGNRLNVHKIQQTLAMIESSSPSFPLLVSLDISRAMIDQAGQQLLEQSIRTANELRSWLQQRNGAIQAVQLDCHNKIEQLSNKSDCKQTDPLRVLLYDRTYANSGFELQIMLEENNCWIEMSDAKYCVLIVSIGMGIDSIDPLKQAITIIEEKIACQVSQHTMNRSKQAEQLQNEGSWELTISKPVVFRRSLNTAQVVISITLEDAEGFEAAEQIIPYPPGIPLLYEGEKWTRSLIHQVSRLAKAGARFQNASDAEMKTVLVYEKGPGV
ncbi:aminotransferase class I/II-fold pyridoxal phosphate-dependent enzyme [Paenibacillus sp. GXUN7292]|uniref:aminotransferase class I/II-fold pyridoxal phosphate-dependent enzyme n=1 Tax=Paenibacillus sp. GXUN7292 TaxID=3422499 RepID=UPI003D7D7CA6